MAPVLVVTDLRVSFPSEAGVVAAVRGLSYHVDAGEVLAVVGESGSGKSVSALAVMSLLPASAQVAGSVRLRGQELLKLGDRELSLIRGKSISIIFQDPLSALTPVYRVGEQIAETVRVHQRVSKQQVARRAVELQVDRCTQDEPDLERTSRTGHLAACHRSGKVEGGALPSDDALGAMNGSRQPADRTGPDRRNVVLRVDGLVKCYPLTTGAVFRRQIGTVRAVDGVSFDLTRQGHGDAVPPAAQAHAARPAGGVPGSVGVVGSEMPVADILAEPLRTHGVPAEQRGSRPRSD